MYYNNLSDYYKKKFGCKVVKLSFNGGFTCPNRLNGSKGCIFCSGSYEYAGTVSKSFKEQYEEQKIMLDNKWPNAKYIAYFGSFTNTFDTVDNLRKKFEEVLTFPNVIGLSIGTRSDCISDECLEYLKDLNQRTFLTIELGLQSSFDETLKFINRGHTKDNFTKCVKKLNIDGIKIHNLFIVKNTPLGDSYLKKPFNLITKDDYINIVCKQLEILNPNIVVHRLTGDPKKEDLIEPAWATRKIDILNGIVKKLKKDKTYQGSKYH